MEIYLGNEADGEHSQVKLPGEVFLRHAVCLGSSGSGKTVACKVMCEEFLLAKVPIIAIDPQGDIASMLLPGDPEEIEKKGLDSALARSFHQQVEVVVWTPGSYIGVPICLDPLRLEGLPQRKSERIRVLSAIAANMTALLGYSLDSNDGQFTSAYLDLSLQYLADHEIRVDDLSGFAAFLDDLPESLQEEASRVIKESKREEVGRKIQVLGIGARKLLFQVGAPVDIDVLLGRSNPPLPYTTDDGESHTPTRLSIIYLNTLHSQEEKEFFISQIAQRLYDWMLNNPASTPQALFYIDEIAPFIPPVRKPACKDILRMLFKQARKYGVSCLIASQNPGDIDYTALAQFSTWALGRMMIRQDIKKVEKMIRSLSPSDVDAIIERLPTLDPGEFLLISPDVFERVVPLNIRWLYTRHETLDEDRIEDLISDEMRERLAQQTDPDGTHSPQKKATKAKKKPKVTKKEPKEVEEPKIIKVPAAKKKKIKVELEEEKPKTHKDLLVEHLDDHPGAYSVKEITHQVAISESLVRKNLKELSEEQIVATAKVGRRTFYWLQGQRFEPSVGIVQPILAMSFRINPERALAIAEGECDSALFGFFKKETVDGPSEKYLLLWRVNITFQKTSGISIFKTKEQKEASVYFHARTGRLLLLDEKQPLKLVESTELEPDALLDLSAKFTLTPHTPAELKLQTRTLKACQTPEAITERCRELFFSKARHPQLVAIPYWKFELRESNTKSRNINIDGLYGHVFEIPKR